MVSTQPHTRVFPSPAPTSARGFPAPAPARPSTPYAACSSGSTFTFGPCAGKGRAGCRGARASQRGPEPQVLGDPPQCAPLGGGYRAGQGHDLGILSEGGRPRGPGARGGGGPGGCVSCGLGIWRSSPQGGWRPQVRWWRWRQPSTAAVLVPLFYWEMGRSAGPVVVLLHSVPWPGGWQKPPSALAGAWVPAGARST